jgi:hypothetical protein
MQALLDPVKLPDLVKVEFDTIDPMITLESHYYGGWNALLNQAFPIQDDYIVHPQVIRVGFILYEADSPNSRPQQALAMMQWTSL